MRMILGVLVFGIVCASLAGRAEARPVPRAIKPAPPVPVHAVVEPEPTTSTASAGEQACRCCCDESDEARENPAQLEFSFGTAQKFFDQSVYEPGGFVSTRTLPVTTLLILGEWLIHPRASVMAHFDLPLEPRTRLTDGELSREYVAPSLSGGIRASAFTFRVLEQTRLEWQFAFLLGSTLADIGRETIFPTVGWRLHLRNKDGLTLYAGATFEFMLNRAALIYGVGQRF